MAVEQELGKPKTNVLRVSSIYPERIALMARYLRITLCLPRIV